MLPISLGISSLDNTWSNDISILSFGNRKVTGSQIWRIRWLSNDFCIVFNQKFSHNRAGMWRRIIVVKNPWVVCPQIRPFTTKCFAQTPQNGQLVFLNANTTIFEHNFLHFFDVIVVNRDRWMTRMRQVFYDLTTLTECFMPLKYLRSR